MVLKIVEAGDCFHLKFDVVISCSKKVVFTEHDQEEIKVLIRNYFRTKGESK